MFLRSTIGYRDGNRPVSRVMEHVNRGYRALRMEVLGAKDGLKALANALKRASWVAGDSGNNLSCADL